MPRSFIRRSLPVAIALAAAGFAPARALAHEFWLSPSSYRGGRSDTVSFGALVGTGFRGEEKPWAAPRALRFTLHGPRVLDLRPVTMNGDVTWARVVLPDDGGALVAYASNWSDITLPAAEFDAYLALEGLDVPLASRRSQGALAGPGRERYARCPKTWIAGTIPERAQQIEGLDLEIVALADPAAPKPLPVRVLYHGRPLPGALVRAWNRPLARALVPIAAASRDSVARAFAVRTGPDGVATLDLKRAGEWMLSCVHMVPSEDRREADWQSLWASLSFARAEPPK